MARKADDLLAELDTLGSEEQPAPTTKPTSKPARKPATSKEEDDENNFGEIEKMLAAKRPVSNSRPTTPRVSSSTTSTTKAVHTPATSSARTSEEEKREEERRNQHQQVEVEQAQQKPAPATSGGAGGGGWWGSMFSAATAAVKQAENLAKEIRGNEEAIKWAEQVRGYGANLSSLSTYPLPTYHSNLY
jgi:hypothetical protein